MFLFDSGLIGCKRYKINVFLFIRMASVIKPMFFYCSEGKQYNTNAFLFVPAYSDDTRNKTNVFFVIRTATQ